MEEGPPETELQGKEGVGKKSLPVFAASCWPNRKPAGKGAQDGAFLRGQLLGLRTRGGESDGERPVH